MFWRQQTIDREGIGIEFEERAKLMGAAMPEPQSSSHALDAEMFKYVADVLVQEAGAYLPKIDGTDASDLTIGEMEGRRQAIHAVAALERFMPGCQAPTGSQHKC